MKSSSYDVVVIGSGPGGYVAAIAAAQRGKRVAVVEKSELGGVCLNWGCIPTKALLKIAEQYEFLKEADRWGFEFKDLTVKWDRVVARSREAASKLSGGVDFLLEKNKVDVVRGFGSFLSPNRIAVKTPEGETREIQTTHAIIATGSRPSTLPGIEPDGKRIITSREAMILPERPARMTIIGAGAIGLEFAYFYAAFGTEVTIVEYAPQILPSGDPDICKALARAFKKRKVKLHTSSEVREVSSSGGELVTRFRKDDRDMDVTSDIVLLAVGIRPNSESLNLDSIAIPTQRGFVDVDEYCQTRQMGVYAIGDVCGPPALAHTASAEALQAVRHLCGEDPRPLNYRNVPSCIYCHPQVASVGMTQPEAEAAGHDIKIGKFPFSANGKAVAVGETEGFVKIIADSNHGEILGAHIIGPDATEIISELVIAKAAELSIDDIHHTIHAHPTLSESIMESAADWAGEVIGM